MINNYFCYLLISANKTYIGITNNLALRLKKHNGVLKGGAKSTRIAKGCWNYHTIIGNFQNKADAMSFEWYWKHIKNNKNKWVKNKSGICNKMKRLLELLLDCKWNNVIIKDFTYEKFYFEN